jgi:prepilin-type N-terminal cleavage/methylation domain-containing protein
MRRGCRPRIGDAGFSLIEVLVAALLFLLVALGVLPLFTRSMVANQSGADATRVSQLALSHLEELGAPPFDGAPVDPGSSEEHFSENERVWKPGAVSTSGDRVLWTRATRITQHSMSDLDADGVLDDPLPVGADESTIHFKLIEVRVGMTRESGSVHGRRPDLVLRAIRPY